MLPSPEFFNQPWMLRAKGRKHRPTRGFTRSFDPDESAEQLAERLFTDPEATRELLLKFVGKFEKCPVAFGVKAAMIVKKLLE